MVKILFHTPIWLLLLAVLLTLVAVPCLHLILLGVDEGWALLVAMIFMGGVSGGLVACRTRLIGWLEGLVWRCDRFDSRHWLLLVLGLGIVLRVCWVGIFNAPLRSDFAIYFDLARGLVERGAYGGDGAYQAYWPPGLPFFLAPFIAIFGPKAWIPLLGNLLLTILTIILTSLLAGQLRSKGTVRIAPLLVAIWPTNVMSAGLASKEQLLLPLLSGAVLTFVRAQSRAGWSYPLLTGVLSGLTALTQPSFILLPAVLFLGEVLATGRLWGPLRRSLVVVIGAALIISPWIWRNYRVFDQLVLISTNGGDVLYRANNPLATGTYTERGEVELQGLAELERNRLGGELAREWILENPRQFLYLALRKQMAFLGDDNMGAYETLRRGLGIGGAPLLISKILSNGYWVLIWLLILLGWLVQRSIYRRLPLSIPVLIVIYQLAIDSVYESGSRHHVPLSGLLALLAAVPFAIRSREQTAQSGSIAHPN
jgi:4-amino-4-deoxy-L-arabinose transferase-like glycosyltransferase